MNQEFSPDLPTQESSLQMIPLLLDAARPRIVQIQPSECNRPAELHPGLQQKSRDSVKTTVIKPVYRETQMASIQL